MLKIVHEHCVSVVHKMWYNSQNLPQHKIKDTVPMKGHLLCIVRVAQGYPWGGVVYPWRGVGVLWIGVNVSWAGVGGASPMAVSPLGVVLVWPVVCVA